METKAKHMGIVTLALALVVVLLLGYIGIDKYNEAQEKKLVEATKQGYNQGINDALTLAFQQTNNCQVTALRVANSTRRIIDFDCVQQQPPPQLK